MTLAPVRRTLDILAHHRELACLRDRSGRSSPKLKEGNGERSGTRSQRFSRGRIVDTLCKGAESHRMQRMNVTWRETPKEFVSEDLRSYCTP